MSRVCPKVALDTVQEAMRELDLAKRTWRYPPIRWYKCPQCSKYHLTAQPKAADVGRRRAEMIGAENRAADKRNRNPITVALDAAKGGTQ